MVSGAAAGERRLDRLSRAAEDCEYPIAEQLALDRRAGVVADDGAERGVEFTRFFAEGGIAKATYFSWPLTNCSTRSLSVIGRQTSRPAYYTVSPRRHASGAPPATARHNAAPDPPGGFAVWPQGRGLTSLVLVGQARPKVQFSNNIVCDGFLQCVEMHS